ncbi:MAG: DUF1150 family protein [Pseudomonadota bacterium]
MTPTESPSIRDMTSTDFAALGAQQVAYVKAVTIDGKDGYAIHSADGAQHLVVESLEKAFAVIRQNDLEPLSVH